MKTFILCYCFGGLTNKHGGINRYTLLNHDATVSKKVEDHACKITGGTNRRPASSKGSRLPLKDMIRRPAVLLNDLRPPTTQWSVRAKHAEETYGCTSFDFLCRFCIINQAMHRLVQKVNGRRFSYKRIALYRVFLSRGLRRDQGFVKIAGQDFAKTN